MTTPDSDNQALAMMAAIERNHWPPGGPLIWSKAWYAAALARLGFRSSAHWAGRVLPLCRLAKEIEWPPLA